MGIINHKFCIGEKVYYVKENIEEKEITCDTCDGNGVVLKLDKTCITCPTCKGKKIMLTFETKPEIFFGIVKEIFIFASSVRTRISYNLGNTEKEENELYTEKEFFYLNRGIDYNPTEKSDDFIELFSKIPKDQWHVHKKHCCKHHGCKYGDKDCPVVLGLVSSDNICTECLPF